MTATVDPYLAGLADRLAAGGVRWAVIRGETDRPSGDDLDLLVHPEDASAFRSIARDLGFPRLPAWGHGEHAFHVGRGTGGWWRLDLLTTFRFLHGERLADDVVPAVLATADGRSHPDALPRGHRLGPGPPPAARQGLGLEPEP